MAEVLGKDLDNYDDSAVANAPFNLVETEVAGPTFITGEDLSRSAKISAEWKKPVAIPAQAKGDMSIPEQIASSYWHGATDAIHDFAPDLENLVAQSVIDNRGVIPQVANLISIGISLKDIDREEIKAKAQTYDEVVDILKDRDYPLAKYARRVIAEATDDVETRKIVRELYNQAQGIDSSALYNKGATIIGAMTPSLTLTRGVYGLGRAFGASRIAATKLAMNVAKGYIGAEMAGQYAEETAAQYRERTGDKNFENFTAKDATGLSALAYGAIGAQIEFMGGVEPIMAGALNKVGLRSSLLKAGTKIGAGEAAEEFLQGITETLMRKIDGSSNKTWKEGFLEALQGAAWGAVIGGGLGTTTFYTNRRNLVKGIKTFFPNISDTEAKLVADAMIDSTAENITQNPTLRSNLREKVAMMYRDVDIENKNNIIDATTDLEYSLIAMDSAERGVDIAENTIFAGEVNELGWFRDAIPENRRAEITALNDEIKGLKEQLAEENKKEEKNWEKIDEIENKLAQANQYILEKISDLARGDAKAIRNMLRETEGRYVKREKERATKKAIKSGNVDIIAEILSKAGFKTRDMSGTTIKQLARLNWELLQDKDLGQSQSRGTIQRKLADIEANVESGNRVLERAGFTQEQIDKMDDETWNRAIQIQFKKETPAPTQPEYTEEDIASWDDIDFQDEVFKVADENARLDEQYPAYEGETIEVDGKERSVYNSNGDRIAKSEPALRNFYKWFGNSKVVDEQGRPLVVYHGTDAEFDTFDMTKGRSTMDIQGAFFSPWELDSKGYGSNVRAFYIKLEKPASEGVAYKEFNKHKGQTGAGTMARESLTFMGYDGVDNSGEEYIVFKPENIKSVDNRGTFSSDTGNIYWQTSVFDLNVGDEIPGYGKVEQITDNKIKVGGIEYSKLRFDTMLQSVDFTPATVDFNKAVDYFGTTTNLNIAGYILPDGRLLDFSGKKFGADGRNRTIDHREVGNAYDNEIDMDDFLKNGAIRIDATSGSINIGAKPTAAQMRIIEQIVSRNTDSVSLELENNGPSLNEVYDNTTPTNIKRIINQYFTSGQVSRLSQFFQNRVSGAAPKDYRGAYIPAYRFIQRANRMDASTLSHELAHDWMEVNFDRFRSGEATEDFMKAWGALEKALGIEENATQVPRKASETFARAYEAWILDNKDWSKFINLEDKDKEAVEKLLKDYQGELRNIYNDINNKYFKDTWGKLGELKPELKAWFDRAVNITNLDILVERGEMTESQAQQEKLNRAIDKVIETTTDEETAQTLKATRLLNDTARYEVEGGNKNSLQDRLSALAREIDENNMVLKKDRYNTRRDMMQVAEAADNFVKTRLDDALAIINGEMAEVEGLYKEDIYTALERLAIENGDMGLINELKNSEIANRLAKELGQRVAGFRNWKQSTEIDVLSALKSTDNIYNKALENKKAKKQFDSALDLLDESLKNQDKVADSQLDSMLKELECA